MARFEVSVLDRAGVSGTRVIESPDSTSAAARVRADGLFPTALRALAPETPAASPATHAPCASRPPFVIGRIAKPAELALFTRQLSTLLHAGLPLVRALQVLARQQRNAAFRWTLESLIADVATGRDLSGAIREHPRALPPLYASLVRAGEASGRLDAVLGQLAQLLEKSERLKGRVRSALFYPAVVLAVTALIVVGLLVFVVPKFKTIFGDLLRGTPLPPLTQAVLGLSEAVRHHWLLGLGGVVLAAVTAKFARRTMLWDRAALRAPIFGDLLCKSAVARGSRTLGTLLGGGVPILQALAIARDTVGNRALAAALDQAHDRVREGQSLSAPLVAARVFPVMATSMIEVGEETGELPAMLGRVADTYDEEVENAAAGLTSIIEPVMIVLLAVVVGTIVLALFLPIVRILQALSGG